MKGILLSIIILFSITIQATELEGYMGTPLFNYRVQDNKLPDGEFVVIRSYRSVTQLLIATETKLILYTDRNNVKDSDIFVSSFSRINDVILSEPSMSQHEFNIKITKIISTGDRGKTSAVQFYGADIYMDEIKKGLKPEKTDGEYYIFLKDNGKDKSLMTINPILKKLTIRNLTDRKGNHMNFYSIYIDECYDKSIRRIITGYSSVIKNHVTGK